VSENTAIVKQQIGLSTWKMIQEAAPVMYKSRLFGVATEEQAMAIMAKGYELGLGLTTSFEFIQVVLGKPTLIPRGALALAYQSGELETFNVIETADKSGQPYSCTVTGRRKGGFDYTVTFTMDDARRTGNVKPGSGWETYPANMLKWRAIGFWLDIIMPDIQGGMKRSDEFGATVDASGNVVEGSFAVETAVKVVPIHTEYQAGIETKKLDLELEKQKKAGKRADARAAKAGIVSSGNMEMAGNGLKPEILAAVCEYLAQKPEATLYEIVAIPNIGFTSPETARKYRAAAKEMLK